MKTACDLHISGIVQGVGFRPFIYRHAIHWGLNGWVLNSSIGVHVHIEGSESSIKGFIDELTLKAPSAAMITSIESEESPVSDLSAFTIYDSQEETQVNTLVSPDIATCPRCLKELFEASDRRFHYPFINCTNCGPRFTIIDELPYDRIHTSMAGFKMCPTCNGEYQDPLNRRFHAQPDACFDCGPSLKLWRSDRDTVLSHDRETSDALIEKAASFIDQGKIVAIKGLGGYHLACDATNEAAVQLLRYRKQRIAKPFALMVKNLTEAYALCHVNDVEASQLLGTVRPIVLLERKAAAKQSALAPSVAGNLHELGIMLPFTPLQHLLMAVVDKPLVMTSGNISEAPIISEEIEAHELLKGVADTFLDNDREILSRYDDSVIRVIDNRVFMIRRARGYAPRPLPFPQIPTQIPASPDKKPPPLLDILATGPEQKNTFCLLHEKQAFLSQHLGDLEDASTFAAWLSTLDMYKRLFDLEYLAIACDKHPEYLSTKWARTQAEKRLEVQHHHAHIASVLAEQQAFGEKSDAGDIALIDMVIGIAFDGTGYGEDASIWGGEVLIAGLSSYRRFAHLRPVPLPGGQAAIKHPDRMAWSYLKSLNLSRHEGTDQLVARIGADHLLLLDQIISTRINSPLTSSMGRLFDAVSALIGICTENSYEGQAAVELEAALYDPTTGEPTVDLDRLKSYNRYRFKTETSPAIDTKPLEFDPTPVLFAILEDLAAYVPPALISLRFHNAVIWLISDLCDEARRQTGLSTVALGGGVFMNRYLVTELIPLLRSEGFTVLMNQELPANDGCISYGQAAVAAARMAQPDEKPDREGSDGFGHIAKQESDLKDPPAMKENGSG